MTNEQIAVANQIRADFLSNMEKIKALPDTGAVLYYHDAGLALRGAGIEWKACGLAYATIRPRGVRWPSITNRAGEQARITPIADAKRMALAKLDEVLVMLDENLAKFIPA